MDFVPRAPPAIPAWWLNSLDVLEFDVFQGAQTVQEVLDALGLSGGGIGAWPPVPPVYVTGPWFFNGQTDETAVVIVPAVASSGAPRNVVGLGVELGAQTVPNQWAEQIWGMGAAPGCSNGLGISAGTNASDWALLIQNAAQTSNFFGIRGDGSGFLGVPPNQILWNSAGSWVLPANWPGGGGGVISTVTAPFSVQAQVTNPEGISSVQTVLSVANPYSPTVGINMIAPVSISPGNDWSSGVILRLSGQVGYDCASVYAASQTAISTVPPGPNDANYWALRVAENPAGSAPGASNGLKVSVGAVAGDTPFMVCKGIAYGALRGSEPPGSIAILVDGNMGGTIGPQMTSPTGVSFSWDTAGHFYVGSALLPGSASPRSTMGHGSAEVVPFTTTQTVKTISHTMTGPGWLLDLGGLSTGLDVPQTTDFSNGLCINMGTSELDAPISVMNSGGTAEFFRIRGDGTGWLGPSAGNCLTWDASGSFSVLGNAVMPAARALTSVTTPDNPFPGQMWFRTSDGSLAVWYDQPGWGHWVSVTGVRTLVDLEDVNVVSPAVGEVLTWNGARWANAPAGGGGAGVTTLVALTDVGPMTPATGDIFGWNGARWINVPAPVNLLPLNNTWSGTNIFNNAATFSGTTGFSSGASVYFWGEVRVERAGALSSLTIHTDGSGSIGPAPNMLSWDTAGVFTLNGTATLPGGGGVTALTGLTDVGPMTPTAGQFLSWNGTRWLNVAAPGGVSLAANNNWTGQQTFSGNTVFGLGSTATFNAATYFNIAAQFAAGLIATGVVTAGLIITPGTTVYAPGTGEYVCDVATGMDFDVNLIFAENDGMPSVTIDVRNAGHRTCRVNLNIQNGPAGSVSMISIFANGALSIMWANATPPMISTTPNEFTWVEIFFSQAINQATFLPAALGTFQSNFS
jgi:hypothetical protein